MTVGFSGDTLSTLKCSECDWEHVVEMNTGDTFGMFVDRVMVVFSSPCPICGSQRK